MGVKEFGRGQHQSSAGYLVDAGMYCKTVPIFLWLPTAYCAMKNLPFLLALALLAGAPRPAAAQRKTTVPLLPTDSLSQRIPFRGVVAVPGVSAAELQARAREWVALTFEDAHQVMQLDDAARGVLIGRAYTNTWVDRALHPNDDPGQLSFAFRLDFREGRYRYEVFELGQPSPLSGTGNSITGTSYQLAQLTALALSSTATVEASPRQRLLEPAPNHRITRSDPASFYGKERAAFAETVQRTVAQLLDGLQQHVTAGPKKW